MPIHSFGYVRVSTDQQDLSVDAQTAAVQRAAKYHQFSDAEIIAEPDTSGALPFLERPQARLLVARLRHLQEQQLLQPLAPDQETAVIIVPKVDRLGRDTVDVSMTVRLLESLGARVLFLDINVDTRTPMGRAFMQIAAVFAELELARIRERIQAALDHKRAHNLCTGTVPYGWDAIATGEVTAKGVKVRRLEPNPGEQQWLLQMHAWRTAGMSYARIAAELNARHVPTKTGAGNIVTWKGQDRFTKGRWHQGKVHKLLSSKTVRDWLTTRNASQRAA